MKYYDEEQTGEIRRALEKGILSWPRVSKKEMMGCLCYFYGKKFFAFLVTKAVVITKLSEDDRVKLSRQMNGEPFKMAGRTVKTWVRVDLKSSRDVKVVLPFVKTSYQASRSRG